MGADQSANRAFSDSSNPTEVSVFHQAARSAEYDRLLAQAGRATRDAIAMTVVGSACSGKTVLAHQLRCLFGAGSAASAAMFSQSEMDAVGLQGRRCALTCGQVLLTAVRAAGTALPPIRNVKAAAMVYSFTATKKTSMSGYGDVSPEMITALCTLWRGEPAFERLWDRRSTLTLPPNAAYFMHHLTRIAAPDYQPRQEDALRCYKPSRGIVEMNIEFVVNRHSEKVSITDVGTTGVRGTATRYQRISDVLRAARGVIYVLNLADYDVTTLHADGSMTNMLEVRLKGFIDFINGNTFPFAMITLILSHRDVFNEKLHTSPLLHRGNETTAPRFRGYKGATFFDALAFLQDMFLNAAKEGIAKRKTVPLRTYALDLIDTAEVAVAVRAISEALVSWNLECSKALDRMEGNIDP
jgi:hypothetical protein